MPPIVKAAFATIKKHAANHPVVLITKDNIRQILAQAPIWDNDILDYLEKGKITITNMSDLARVALLYSFGGIWIDSTIFMHWDIDRIIEGLSFVTGRRERFKDSFNVCHGKWTTFFIGCGKGNSLMKFVYELLHAHLKHYGGFLEFLMMDYVFMTAYNNIPYMKEMADAVPLMPNRLKELYAIRNNAFNNEHYESICNKVPFTKMTYKKKNEMFTSNGKLTYVGYMMSNASV